MNRKYKKWDPIKKRTVTIEKYLENILPKNKSLKLKFHKGSEYTPVYPSIKEAETDRSLWGQAGLPSEFYLDQPGMYSKTLSQKIK